MFSRYSVCIVSYQPVLLEGILNSFGSDPHIEIAGIGTSAAQAQELGIQKKPDILLLDSACEERRLACIQRMKSASPNTRIVVLTGSENVDHAVRALEAGVGGYLTTRATGSEIVRGVRRVLQGERLVCSSLAMNVMNRIRELAAVQSANQKNRLTRREKEVAELLAGGLTNKEIADRIGISERTVKHYMSCLMQKFAARNRTELVIALSGAQTATVPRKGATGGFVADSTAGRVRG